LSFSRAGSGLALRPWRRLYVWCLHFGCTQCKLCLPLRNNPYKSWIDYTDYHAHEVLSERGVERNETQSTC
jgi:hypothetical protein